MDNVLSAVAKMLYLIDVSALLLDVDKHPTTGQANHIGQEQYVHLCLLEKEWDGMVFHPWHQDQHCVWENGSTTVNDDDGHQFSMVHQLSKYGGHTHVKCPPNLCKSQVLLDILNRTARAIPQVVYIGDGSSDACPVS